MTAISSPLTRLAFALLAATTLWLTPVAQAAFVPDSNNNSIPDSWERRNGLSISQDTSASDPDEDGLNNLAEYQAKTKPKDADTDNDDLKDGAEIARNTKPRKPDTDTDGLKDGREVKLGTDPLDKDTDGDRKNDGLEVRRGTDPLFARTKTNDINDNSILDSWERKYDLTVSEQEDLSRADSDGDELSNLREFQANLHPRKKDTDSDGLDDYEELSRACKETSVKDSKGVSHTIRICKAANPRQKDTDHDGLTDGAEYNQHETNPLVADTDSDGKSDGYEVSGGPSKKVTDPKVSNKVDLGKDSDTDKDGLTAEQERKAGSDPRKADTDGDGLNDKQEVVDYKTNPLIKDSDRDGLGDLEEVTIHTTNPIDADSDDDGHKDGAEVTAGSNPKDATSFPAA